MKIKIYILFLIFFFGNNIYCQNILLDSNNSKIDNFFKLEQNFNANFHQDMVKKKGYKPLSRYVNFMKSRVDSYGKFSDPRHIYNAYRNFNIDKNPAKQSNVIWKEVGPRSPQIGSNKQLSGSGRINCIEFASNDSNLIWAGSASGGLWRSNDRGKSWEVIDFTEFLSMGVSDIAISKANPNILYVATGDADGGSFLGCYSLGIIKTTDGGTTWTVLNTEINYSDGEFISKILINPLDESILYASTSKSIIKSTDAGASWQVLLSGFNFRDLLFKPDDPTFLYATTYSLNDGAFLFFSDDSGRSWFVSKHFPDANRIKLAVTKRAPDRVLALCSDKRSGSFGGLYLSDSYGTAWKKLLDDTLDYNHLVQAQGFFNLVLYFSPFDKDVFFIGGVWLYKGNVKSNVFYALPDLVHVDMHDLKYNPNDSLFYLANDGGIFRFDYDLKNIENVSSNLGITQFYRFGLHPNNPEIIYAGSQDNNIFEYFYNDWNFFWAGDGMECFVDVRDPSLIYYSTQRGMLFNSKYGLFNVGEGELRPWVTSFLMQPLNPDVIYCGFENVWRSTNQGQTFLRISSFSDKLEITSIALSRRDSNIIYASNAKNIYRSSDYGASWTNLFSSKDFITALKTDSDDHLWITIGRFNPESKVLLISNDSLHNHTFNLPNVPINCIEIDTLLNKIYVGTDIGVFEKQKNSTKWEKTGLNLPAVIVKELEIHYGTGTLFAATFGRGLWSFDLFDCNIEKPKLLPPSKRIFCNGENILLKVEDSSNDLEYTWNDGTKGSEKIVSQKGIYYVTARNKSNCIAASDTLFVWKPSKGNISLVLMSPNPICEGDTARLLASFAIEQSIKDYGWSNGTKTLLGKFSQTGNYYFYLLDEYDCFYSSDTVNIFVNPIPQKPTIRKEGNWLYASNGDYFRWYRDDILLNEYEGNSCYISSPGKYEVLIRDTNYCFNYSEALLVKLEGTIENNLQYDVFPNPSDGFYNLELNLVKESDVEIKIYDAIGQLLYEKYIPHFEGYKYESVNLKDYAQSVYYLLIKTKYGSTSKILINQ